MKKPSISIRSTVVAAKGQISADLDGETAILGLQNGVYYGLNSSGSRLWAFIARPRKVGEICDFLAGLYSVEKNRCERDVAELLEQLREESLIEIRNEPSE